MLKDVRKPDADNGLSRLVPLAGESDVQSIGACHVLLGRACFINEPIERAQAEGRSPLTAGSTMGDQPGELEWLGVRAPIPEGASATNDCDKFQSKSLASPTALVSAQSGCLSVMEPRNAEHRALPWDTRRTRCRLSRGEHLKINNINDDFSLLVTNVCALRSDAIMLAGMQSPTPPPYSPPPSEMCLSC
ncbi:hypothetical protein CRENBAI_023244 [Crenichthys baileyi]|uniref:Uncharacterized protein n=1 Tax=Crenichthys baileyi TaxID=28760 RepID=A0AAV9RHW4_9TELE